MRLRGNTLSQQKIQLSAAVQWRLANATKGPQCMKLVVFFVPTKIGKAFSASFSSIGFQHH